ncbi:MAG: periplasmic heavy metal sensor [Desulfobacterales bacterium]|nr:periplasmic heavy metal sensor [Deltaproteobacteria bacterium]NNL42193.1 periplasmic heavy metal sensor [Desulfobacterales bacterium]
MLRKILYTVLLLVFLILPATAAAKNNGLGKWWRHPKVAEKLSLSEDEISNLDRRFVDSRRKLIKLESDLKSEQFELDHLLQSESLDEKETVRQFDKLQQARTNLGKEQFRFLLEIRKILGIERFRQLKQYKQLRRQKMRRELRSMRDHSRREPGSE